MTSLFLSLGSLIALTMAVERISWVLFRRKMEPLRFPSSEDPSGSYRYWLKRVRLIAIMHTAALTLFITVFCSALW